MTARDWQNTTLWSLLMSRQSTEAIRASVQQLMPDIERVLRSGGTAPTDFTLHDADHGFRVAERMVNLVSTNVLERLSTYELVFLLLSAYLHDIGMTPDQRHVRDHHLFLLTGDHGHLKESELTVFQEWLDDHFEGLNPPIGRDGISPEVLTTARRAIAHYCRHRHNDWGEQWTRAHLVGVALGSYAGWLDDLVVLCRSHHYGYDELRGERFTPRIVGAPAAIVNLRYLACVLRVADILEFDPERTPDVILAHRDIADDSVVYWWKDHEISMNLTGGKILISARPTRAGTHRAIDVMADDIARELETCRRLADETHFDRCPGLVEQLPHRWDIGGFLHRDIAPRDQGYEYINGAFRPNTAKLLTLLSGQHLYGSPLSAVRELLQNAFDAVKEQIAYERLRQSSPGDPVVAESIANLQSVELRLEPGEDALWLVCRDTGVGMSKQIIRDYLLVSGASRRHEILSLERRCQRAGFDLGRTGQFGIGVLSYFMISDRVVIRTRRSQDAGDDDGTGWRFETEGVGSFGELRRIERRERGSELALRIRRDVVEGDARQWYQALRGFVSEATLKTPCRFQLSSPIGGCEPFACSTGWTIVESEMTQRVLRDFLKVYAPDRNRSVPTEVLSARRQQEIESVNRERVEAAEELARLVRWRAREGRLPDDLGSYRVHIPYFELDGGRSVAFLRVRRERKTAGLLEIGQGSIYSPGGGRTVGWKGMRVGRGAFFEDRFDIPDVGGGLTGAFIECDFESDSAGTISVSRQELRASETFRRETVRWLAHQVADMYREIVDEGRGSEYSLLSRRIRALPISDETPKRWLSIRKSVGRDPRRRRAEWGEFSFPVISALALIYIDESALPKNLRWRGHRVTILPALGSTDSYPRRSYYDGLDWVGERAPDALLESNVGYLRRVIPVWTKMPGGSARAGLLDADFPPAWAHIVGVTFDHYTNVPIAKATIWNRAHPVVLAATDEGMKWGQAALGKSLDPLPRKDEILQSKSRAAAWLLNCLVSLARDLWEGLPDRDAGFLPAIWGLLFDGKQGLQPELHHYTESPGSSRLRLLSPSGWTVVQGYEKLRDALPDAGDEWRLVDAGRSHATTLRGNARASSGPKASGDPARGTTPKRKQHSSGQKGRGRG